jgi:phosphate transport system ATP-binding protein
MKSPVSIQNLSIYYDNHLALYDISLDIPDKQITAIIGPSGCGKTTLLKSLNRLHDLSEEARVEGQVLIDGVNIYSDRVDVPALRKKVGLLAQKPYPLPMSIYNNVAYGLRIHGTRNRKALDEKVRHYLEVAGLWEEVKDRLRAPASKLSVGQQQRLCLARGLAVEPQVILCDEPTSALDPVSVKLLEEKLLELKRDYTIVLVTHLLPQARRLADYVVYLYLGNLIEQGPADRFFADPQDPRTESYLSGEVS